MGKENKLKAIRKIAKSLPPLVLKNKEGGLYEVDHYKVMKHLYLSKGEKYVMGYSEKVIESNSKISS